jgi:hypothetical protein
MKCVLLLYVLQIEVVSIVSLRPSIFLLQHTVQSLCFPSGCGIITCSFPFSLCSLLDVECCLLRDVSAP